MTSDPAQPGYVIVGAGLAGSLMAVYLGRQGHRVQVYERRGDPRKPDHDRGSRSYNLGLSARGMRALRGVGLLEEVLACTVPMRGRAIHTPDGATRFQPYGTDDSQILHSVIRRDLNVLLVEKAESHPGVEFTFGTRLAGLDCERGSARFLDEATGRETTVQAEVLIGADGVNSEVRKELMRSVRADFRQDCLPWGYKELTITPNDDGSPRVDLEAFHIWPGEAGLIVAHPNADNSLTGTLFLPHEGRPSFDSVRDAASVERLFAEHFPGAAAVMPGYVSEFLTNPTGTLTSVRTSPWHLGGRVVLIGDACHAVYPFYGQGMNAAFEDCVELDAALRRHPGDSAAAFRDFQDRRKPNTDVLADLSEENFEELRDRVRSPLHTALRKADLAMNRMLPKAWMPLYTMISHTTMPYGEALARARRQERVLKALSLSAAVLTAVGADRALRRLAARRAGR